MYFLKLECLLDKEKLLYFKYLPTKKVPKGKIDNKQTIPKVLPFQLSSYFNIIAIIMYTTNSNPCGIPNNFTYSGFPCKYLIGVAIKSNNI